MIDGAVVASRLTCSNSTITLGTRMHRFFADGAEMFAQAFLACRKI
jgi:hypothetical protein